MAAIPLTDLSTRVPDTSSLRLRARARVAARRRSRALAAATSGSYWSGITPPFPIDPQRAALGLWRAQVCELGLGFREAGSDPEKQAMR